MNTAFPEPAGGPPRVIDVDLDRGPGPWRAVVRAARDDSHGAGALGFERWGGGALALALLAEHAEHAGLAEISRGPAASRAAPLVLAVGEGVRRGLPTAARLTVASRSPLSGLYADGQVGSDLARRLASVADALVIRGRLAGARGDAVLVIDAAGTARVERIEGLAGLSSQAAQRVLEARFGPSASLSVGPLGDGSRPVAGRAGIAGIASLAACSSSTAGGGAPHFVGRGGLGAVLGRAGLKAVVVLARGTAPSESDARAAEIRRALGASPRLESRAQGGTLELAHTLAARGDLGGGEHDPEAAHALGAAAEAARARPHGCQGCPTPCGWVFHRSGGPVQAARFGATHALSLELGFSDFDAALGLLARCDELGIDAKETGASLALITQLEPALRGDARALAQVLETAAAGEGPYAALLDGLAALGESVGRATTTVRRSSVRPDKNLASLLGQCASARGTDPMRAFPFLAAESPGFAELAELAAPLVLEPGSENPLSPLGKGRLVGWHEDLALALDLVGFCAFSASALIADRLASLDALAQWIAPAALAREPSFQLAPGRALLDAGAELAAAQRELNRRWGWNEDADVPAWARERLLAPGMLPEYRAYRSRRESFFAPRAAGEPRPRNASPGSASAVPRDAAVVAEPTRAGRVRLRAFGSLGQSLGGACELELALPASAFDVLRAAARARPEAAEALFRGEALLPAVYRAGRRVAPADSVRDGETLDLILVVGGG